MHRRCRHRPHSESRPLARLPGYPDPNTLQCPILLLSVRWVSGWKQFVQVTYDVPDGLALVLKVPGGLSGDEDAQSK